MRVFAGIAWRRLGVKLFSSICKKSVHSQISESDVSNIKASMRMRHEVAKIEIPIVQETEVDRLR